MKILLVEPSFPIPHKSKNHAHFLPIGLLKIGTYHKSLGDHVVLIRGLQRCKFEPDRILITSLFTYWSSFVHEAAKFYHSNYPNAIIDIGGIYASLMPNDCKERSSFVKVHQGLYRDGVAESMQIDYSLLPDTIDYQIIHASRGCTRHCVFCGTWRIEPSFTYKSTVIPEIQKNKLVFYDNNLLANPNIDTILTEMATFRFPNGRSISWECQSGLYLHLLTHERALLLRKSHMKYPRIAWDGDYSHWPKVRSAVDILKSVGYTSRDIFVFMIYNHEINYSEMMKKLEACRRWRVRVIDCRYRPLDSTSDGYIPGKKTQPKCDYYIHPNWTDLSVRRFRRNVRRQNIAILLDLPDGRYIDGCERHFVSGLS